MAPKKPKAEKGDKSTAEDGSVMILNYLRQQNRPYSAIDISANLHNKVSKAYTVKALKEMHERKQVEGKTSGKQVVYHAIQEPSGDATPEEIAVIDQEIEDARGHISTSKAQEKQLKAELATLKNRIPTAQLQDNVVDLVKERDELLNQLAPLRNCTTNIRTTTGEERAQVDKDWKLWQGQALARKKICRGLWERCTEILPEGTATKQDLWESLGLEGSL